MLRSIAATLWVLAVLGLAIGGAPRGARANGVPQLVKLTYLAGVSNFGPKDGEGVLEFSFAEAYLRVDVKNLKTVEGYAYEGWLLAPDGAGYRVGDIPVNAAGIGGMETRLQGLSRYDYDLFVVAGRPAGDATAALPPQKSIAGRFAVLLDGAKPGAGEVRPSTLPDTGEKPPGSTAVQAGRLAAGLAIAAGVALAGWGLIRRGRDA